MNKEISYKTIINYKEKIKTYKIKNKNKKEKEDKGNFSLNPKIIVNINKILF